MRHQLELSRLPNGRFVATPASFCCPHFPTTCPPGCCPDEPIKCGQCHRTKLPRRDFIGKRGKPIKLCSRCQANKRERAAGLNAGGR